MTSSIFKWSPILRPLVKQFGWQNDRVVQPVPQEKSCCHHCQDSSTHVKALSSPMSSHDGQVVPPLTANVGGSGACTDLAASITVAGMPAWLGLTAAIVLHDAPLM